MNTHEDLASRSDAAYAGRAGPTAARPAIRSLALAVLACGLLLAGCGTADDTPTVTGVSVAGPGAQTGPPPWKPEYAHLKARIAPLKLPSPGTEKFHVHELLHIYADGLLVPLAKNIGVDESRRIETALHTHDSTGVIHMEADKPFKATLGDLFQVWGISFGPDHIGGLKATKDNPLRVYVDGKLITDPAAHVLRKDDNIVVAYGSTQGIPLVPGDGALKAANGKGGNPVACSTDKHGKTRTKCFITRKP